jgi:hypothetical protein
MILYFLENILAILFCAARVRVLAPARDEAYSSAARSFAQLKVNDRIVFQRRPPADRGALLSGYLLASLGLSLGTAVFMAIFLFLILDMSISRTAIVAGMAGIAVFQVFNFVADLFLLDSLSPGQAEMLLQRSMHGPGGFAAPGCDPGDIAGRGGRELVCCAFDGSRPERPAISHGDWLSCAADEDPINFSAARHQGPGGQKARKWLWPNSCLE